MEDNGDSSRNRNVSYVRLIDDRIDSQINYNKEGTSNIFAVFLIVNGTLGSGLLNFPKTFDDAGGIIAASVVQIILLVFVMVSLIALAYASDQCGDNGAENIQVCFYCISPSNDFFFYHENGANIFGGI